MLFCLRSQLFSVLGEIRYALSGIPTECCVVKYSEKCTVLLGPYDTTFMALIF